MVSKLSKMRQKYGLLMINEVKRQMLKLSIQDWIKTINLHYINVTNIERFSNDLNSYDELIQSMQTPSDFENLNDYSQYCNDIQKQLREQKINEHIKLAKVLNRILDEFHLLTKTPSEQILSEYIKYLKNNEVKYNSY